MNGMAGSEHRVMVILPDNTALCFSAIEHDPAPKNSSHSGSGGPKHPWRAAPKPESRVAKFLKSLFPHVSRVSPVEAMLESGRRLKLIAPPAVH